MAHNEVNHAAGKKGQPAEQPRSQRLSFLPPPRGGPPWSERGGDKDERPWERGAQCCLFDKNDRN